MKFRTLLIAGLLALIFPVMASAATKFEFDRSYFHVDHEEFDRYAAGDWTITTTEAGAGSATEALTSVDGGALLITNDDADNDLDFFQRVAEGFRFDSTKRLYFKARFRVSDATQSDFIIGLQITDTTALDVTDGIFFQKDDGDTNLDLHVEKNNTASDATAIATIAADTFITVAFYYDPGQGTVQYYLNDSLAGFLPITNVPDDEDLAVSFGLQNGEAAAKTMTIDFIFVAKER